MRNEEDLCVFCNKMCVMNFCQMNPKGTKSSVFIKQTLRSRASSGRIRLTFINPETQTQIMVEQSRSEL